MRPISYFHIPGFRHLAIACWLIGLGILVSILSRSGPSGPLPDTAAQAAQPKQQQSPTTVVFLPFVRFQSPVGTLDILSRPPTNLEANGNDTFTVTVRVSDTMGSALVDFPILFETTFGTLNAATVRTNAAGQAAAQIQMPSRLVGTQPITATVLVQAGEFTATQTFVVAPATIGSVRLSDSPDTIEAVVGRRSQLRLDVLDRRGFPVVGRDLIVTTSLSSFDTGEDEITATTDDAGQIQLILRSIDALGDIRIAVREDPRATTPLASTVIRSVPAECPDVEPDNNSMRRGEGNPRELLWRDGICRGRIAMSGPTAALEGDSDHYAVELRAQTGFEVSLFDLPEGVNYDIFLFPPAAADRNVQLVASSTQSGNANEFFVFQVRTSGRYFIRVLAVTKAEPNAPDSYLLRVKTNFPGS